MTTESNVTATLSNLIGDFVLAPAQPATINVGSLPAGDSIFVGWLVAYPCDGSKNNQPSPSSPATLDFQADSGSSVSRTVTLTSRNALSANAGGQIISTILGPGAVVGMTITADVTFGFGNIDQQNEFLTQPAGNTDFDSGCLQLVETEVISSNVQAATVGDKNKLYFVSPVQQSGNGYFIEIRFFYRYLCANVVSVARPFSVQTSGNTNIKYSGNYDGGTGITFDFPVGTNPFTLSKTVNQDNFLLGQSLPHIGTYTISVTNPSAFDSKIDRIEDVLPSGASFVAVSNTSDVNASNSSTLPANGDTTNLDFIGLTGTSYDLPAGGTLSLIYTANIDDTLGTYTNSASAYIGSTLIDTDSVDVFVLGGAELTGSKTVDVWDPNSEGLYAIPGNDVLYTISASNIGNGPSDADSILLIDVMPSQLEFYNDDIDGLSGPETGPIIFAQSSGAGLSFDPSTDVRYFDGTVRPTTFADCDYTPASGYDPNVSFICFNPKGSMQSGDPDPEFSVSFRARIE